MKGGREGPICNPAGQEGRIHDPGGWEIHGMYYDQLCMCIFFSEINYRQCIHKQDEHMH